MITINEAANEKIVFLRLGTLTAETYQPKLTTGKTGSIHHIALSVHYVDKIYKEVKADGYKILGNENPFFLEEWSKILQDYRIEQSDNRVLTESLICMEGYW